MKYKTTIQPFSQGELSQPGDGWMLQSLHVLGSDEKLLCVWGHSGTYEKLGEAYSKLAHEFAEYRSQSGDRNLRARMEVDSAIQRLRDIGHRIMEHTGPELPGWLGGSVDSLGAALQEAQKIMQEQLGGQ